MSILLFGHNRLLSISIVIIVLISIFRLPNCSSLQTQPQQLKAWGGIQNPFVRDSDDHDANSAGSSTTDVDDNSNNTSQPLMLNGTANTSPITTGPHLVVSGRLVTPAAHHRIAQPLVHSSSSSSALFRAPMNASK